MTCAEIGAAHPAASAATTTATRASVLANRPAIAVRTWRRREVRRVGWDVMDMDRRGWKKDDPGKIAEGGVGA